MKRLKFPDLFYKPEKEPGTIFLIFSEMEVLSEFTRIKSGVLNFFSIDCVESPRLLISTKNSVEERGGLRLIK